MPYHRNAAQARYKEKAALIHGSREGERERERERKPLREDRPPNLLNIALFELTPSCLHPCPFLSRLGSRTLALSMHM